MKSLLVYAAVGMSMICICCSHPGPGPVSIRIVQVYYKTSNGSDLLNPKTPGHIDTVKAFDLMVNGTSNPSLFNTYGPSQCSDYFCQPHDSGDYSVQFALRATTELKGAIIQAGSFTDTLTYQIISAAPYTGYVVNSVSYKGQVVVAKEENPILITFVK
jgi:hypothetical protein